MKKMNISKVQKTYNSMTIFSLIQDENELFNTYTNIENKWLANR